MITGQIKNQIDQIWDTFWNAGITNSLTVLEQMTYLFFMKMLDDAQINKEAIANSIGVQVKDPTFDYGLWPNPETGRQVPKDHLRWHNFKHFEPEQMFRTVKDDVFAYIKCLGGEKGDDSAYSRFMRNAVFLIQEPRKLAKIVDGIDALDMNNRDTMGDVYEYVLGKMAASGNNGQFRTPRHIIRMMVELMQPTLDDTICDPAMGSAGFIVESAKYLKEHYSGELKKKANAEHFRNTMLHGFDTDATMLRIGAMNLMLHGVDNPTVEYRDSLSEDNTDADRYSLILANPPFAGSLDNESVAKSLLSISKTKKTELLFMSLFVRSLRVGGRCASIVPDGVLTGSSKAHVALRRELVDNQRLVAVISMPSGVFKPYSGVSTGILIFTKTNSGGTDRVWFYDMKADGLSLDDKRNPVADNDIPDIIARFRSVGFQPADRSAGNRSAGFQPADRSVAGKDAFHTAGKDAFHTAGKDAYDPEESRSRTDQSFFVPVEEIREHGYDLSFNTYKETVRESVHYDSPEVIIARIEEHQRAFDAAFAELKKLLNS